MKRCLAVDLIVTLVLINLAPHVVFAKTKQIKVAVIDTGIDPLLMNKPWICKTGHKDFTGLGLADSHGHGTHISSLIDQYAKGYTIKVGKDINSIENTPTSYCQIIIKYYNPQSKEANLTNTIKAFRWAINQGVNVINYSGGGPGFNQQEHDIVVEALNKGIKVVTAAGNEGSNMAETAYYPAMHDKRIYIVGNLVTTKVQIKVVKKYQIRDYKLVTVAELATVRDIASTSNYGAVVNDWQVGTNVLSKIPGGKIGLMTGTSQACAIKSGKIVKEMLSFKKTIAISR